LRLQLLAIGKLKSGPEKLLAEDYTGRIEQIRRKSGITQFDVKVFSESVLASKEQRMKAEAQELRGALAGGAETILLDERGKTMSSAALSDLIGKKANTGVPSLAFLIGGPDGHAPDLRETAHHVLSFGAMTWPHRLVRIMVLEQIYRSLTILQNHPYHRE
jgi:23S rRNA (pseudouridine1915-N3)-methyltransferase